MPRITAVKMRGNHSIDGVWCPGCGLHHKATGEHRADCTRGHHGHVFDEPCTDRCVSTDVIHSGDNPLHDGPDTRASPKP